MILSHSVVGPDLSRADWESTESHTLTGGSSSAGSVLAFDGAHILGVPAPPAMGAVLTSGAGSALPVWSASGNTGEVFMSRGNAATPEWGSLVAAGAPTGIAYWNAATNGLSVVTPGATGAFLQQTGAGAFAWTAIAPSMSNPMTALGDLIVGGASGTPTRLSIGSDSRVLTVVSGNVAWATLPASITNPMTTAEDIIKGGASGTPTRLAVGSNGNILTVVSGAVAWAAPSTMTNPMTTAEDIIKGGASGTPTRLAVGSNGNILTITAGAVGWAAPANVMTTAEDMIKGGTSGTPTRLAVGSNGNILTVTAGVVGWAAPATMTNPMTTAGDIIVGGTSGAPTRLAKGSDTTILTMVAGSVAWAAPATMTNPMTTSGDLIVGGASGAPTRKAIGTNSQFLTVLSGVVTWANLSLITTDSLVISSAIQEAISINRAAGDLRLVAFKTSNSYRWAIQINGTGEAGSNAGSDFDILRYSDAGAIIGSPALRIFRADGSWQTYATGLYTFIRDTTDGYVMALQHSTATLQTGLVIKNSATTNRLAFTHYNASYASTNQFSVSSASTNEIASLAVPIYIGTTGTNDINIYTGTTQRMNISASTASTFLYGTGTNSTFVVRNTGTTNYTAIAIQNNAASITNTFLVYNSAYVGTGNFGQTAAGTVELVATAPFYMGTNNANSLFLGTNAVTRMTIDSVGLTTLTTATNNTGFVVKNTLTTSYSYVQIQNSSAANLFTCFVYNGSYSGNDNFAQAAANTVNMTSNVTFTVGTTASAHLWFGTNGTLRVVVRGDTGHVQPAAHNTYDLGISGGGGSWRDVWCQRGAFNGSHSSLKYSFKSLPGSVALEIVKNTVVGTFKYYATDTNDIVSDWTRVGILADHSHKLLSPDGFSVNGQDTACLALAAIVGVDDKMARLEHEVAELRERIKTLEAA